LVYGGWEQGRVTPRSAAVFEIFRVSFAGDGIPMLVTATVCPADRNHVVYEYAAVPQPGFGLDSLQAARRVTSASSCDCGAAQHRFAGVEDGCLARGYAPGLVGEVDVQFVAGHLGGTGVHLAVGAELDLALDR
jgi:hypothetical protein